MLLLMVLLPFFGSAIDFYGQRPRKWKILTAVGTVSILGTAALGVVRKQMHGVAHWHLQSGRAMYVHVYCYCTQGLH